jgi:tetratricopeptide (TPR) repeat protein
MPKKKSNKSSESLGDDAAAAMEDFSHIEQAPLTGDVIKTPSKASKLKKSKSSKSSKHIEGEIDEISKPKKPKKSVSARKPARSKSMTDFSTKSSSKKSKKSKRKLVSSKHSRAGSINSAPLDALTELVSLDEADDVETQEGTTHSKTSQSKDLMSTKTKSKNGKSSKKKKKKSLPDKSTSSRMAGKEESRHQKQAPAEPTKQPSPQPASTQPESSDDGSIDEDLPFEEVDYDDGQRPAQNDDENMESSNRYDDEEDELIELGPTSHGRISTSLHSSGKIHDDYAEIKESALIIESPPIGEIVATQTDDDEVSEIGEAALDENGMDPVVVDGVEIIFNPRDHDICFDDRGHPGTTDLIHVLRDLLVDFEGTEYSPPVYKAIKKRLKGRKFLIRMRRDERTSWREATKPEVIQLLGDCFNEERRRQAEGVTDDASEIDSSLNDSAQQPSDNSDFGEDEHLISPGTPSRHETPRHSNMNPAPLPRRTQSLQPKHPSNSGSNRVNSFASEDAKTPSPRRSSVNNHANPRDSLEHAIMECREAQEYARPFDNIDKMHEGIAAEEKLFMLLELADAPKTRQLKDELVKLHDLAKRMKYASLAPLMEMLEKVEAHASEYFHRCSENSGETSEEVDGSSSRRTKEESTDRSSDRDTGNGMRHKRSITVSSDTGHDRDTDHSVSINDRVIDADQNDGILEESDLAGEDSHVSLPLKGLEESNNLDHSHSKSNRCDRSEGSMSNLNGLEKSYQEGFGRSKGESFEQAGETYTIAMNMGSYVEGESEGSFEYDDSRRTFDDSRKTTNSNLPDVDEGENESADGAEYDDNQGVDGSNFEEEEEYEEEVDEEYEEEEADLEPSESNVDDGHVLELDQKNDDMSSVGRSIPDFGSESDDDEDLEEVEAIDDEDDEDEDGRSQSSASELSNATPEPVKPKSIFEKPNPKSGQFFDRLDHFFEVRRKTEEKAVGMDPSRKLRALKVKVHSGGIQNSNGVFKKEYQQRGINDRLVQSLDDLYKVAEPAETELKFFLHQMTQEVKGLETYNVKVAPVKPRDRAFEKATSEYHRRIPGPPESWLYDIVRASIVCKSYKQISDVNKWLGKNCHVVQAKNRFTEPCFNGYRDLLFHVSIPFRGELAHICEIQVHHKDMLALNEQYGLPKHYEFFRSCFVSPWRTQTEILEDLTMLNKFGKIEGPCMKKLLKSKDPEQILLVAGLCRDKLDDFTRALELYRRVLNLQEGEAEADDEEIAATYISIGLVLGSMGDIEESLINLKKALEIQESCLGGNNVEVADTYTEIGHLLRKKGDFSGALTQYQRALVIRETKLGSDHFQVITSLKDIGHVLQEKGDFMESEDEYRRALRLQEKVLGDIHPDVAATHAMIGTTLCLHGDFNKAMEEHRLALSIRETVLGKNSPFTAQSHTDIGILLCQKGDYEMAEWRHNKALRIREATRGKDDEECAISHGHLGEVLSLKGDYDGAVNELKRAQEIREANVGMDSPITAGSYIDLGNIYCRFGKYPEALAEYRRAKVIRESILGPKHPDTALAYMCMGNALVLQGDIVKALTEHRKALAVFETVLGTSHPRTATAYQSHADALLANDDRDEALIEHRKALAIRANVLAKDHPDTAKSCSRIGGLLSGKGDLVGALVAYRQALAITASLCGADHPETASAHVNVGRVLAAQGDVEEAMDEIQHALSVRESTFGKDHRETARLYQMMGSLHSMQGEFEDAHDFHTKAVDSFTKTVGKRHPETKAARKLLTMADNEEEEEQLCGSVV